jgi:acyl-CoA synthetase (NDP forming)
MGRIFEEAVRRIGREKRRYLMEHESKSILEEIGVATTGGTLAYSEAQAVEIFDTLNGKAAAMKVVSPKIVHKSDAGGVKLNIRTAAEARSAYNEIMGAFKGDHAEAVCVQGMAKPGIEAIIGVTRDPTFGPLLMFGLGGVFVEVLKDVSFRSIPVSGADVSSMIEEIKGYGLLKGARGHAV